MRCPKCLNKTKVMDTRTRLDNTIRRNRICTVCGHRFASDESIETEPNRINRRQLTEAAEMIDKALAILNGPPNGP